VPLAGERTSLGLDSAVHCVDVGPVAQMQDQESKLMSLKRVLNAKKKATLSGSFLDVPRCHDVVALALFFGGIEVLGDEQLVGEVVPPFAVVTSADDVATSAANQRAQERACTFNVPFNTVVPYQARELPAPNGASAQRGAVPSRRA
jgi:hypothetical protein